MTERARHTRHATLPPNASQISQACDLLNELNHLALLDLAGAVLVELGEALIEVSVAEASAVSHVLKSIHDELFGLVLIELARVVLVVFGPDLVDAFCDNYINFRHWLVILLVAFAVTVTFLCHFLLP